MEFMGLHWLDILVVLAYLLAMLTIGIKLVGKMKNETDFYLSGRGLGRWLQFFLNFGNMTDANGAASIASEVFRQGVGGVWIGLQTLFITPFYWFSSVWFRRMRHITISDMFAERFGSRRMATIFAIYAVSLSSLGIGLGYMAAYKVTSAMLIKSSEKYTQQEAQVVAQYEEYQELRSLYRRDMLDEQGKERLDELTAMEARGEIRGFISYVQPLPFIIFYASLIGIYIMAGGLSAAVFTDAIQGFLIIVFSIVLIPVGLVKLGGFSALHESVPEHMFRIFGSVQMSEYTWYSILAITLTSMIQIFGLLHNMTIGGSAKNEMAARMGAVTGGFTKRFMLIAWMFSGLIAYALYRDSISDPDNTWGFLSYQLLGPGMLGLMIAGMLAANMSTVDAAVISTSALGVRNIYTPLFPGRSNKHYVNAGRVLIIIMMVAAIPVALYMRNIVPLIFKLITLNAVWGAVVLLIVFWRRLTESSAIIAVILWAILIGALPIVMPLNESFRQIPALTAQTHERRVPVVTGATREDVQAGLAKKPGESIEKLHVIAPDSIFFEAVAPIDPNNPNSALEGVGRFNVEVWLLSIIGLPVETMHKAQLVTARWLFDGIFPFVVLILLSLVTKPVGHERIERFYAKLKTPVAPTEEEDEEEVRKSFENPGRFDNVKLFPNSNWEFTKWDKMDVLGFVGCWILVAGIVLFLWGLLSIGAM